MAETDKDDLISILEEHERETDVPNTLPLLPVRDAVIFIDMVLPLFVSREKSVQAVEEAVSGEGFLFLATQKDPGIENPKPTDIFSVGTVGRILRVLKLPDGSVKILAQGVVRGRILNYEKTSPLFQVKIKTLPEQPVEKVGLEIEALMRNVREQSEKVLALRGELTADVKAILGSIEDPGRLADIAASNLKLKINESQLLLELIDPIDRLKKINDLLFREVELSAMQAKIQSDVRDEISKSQRDYFLREQVRAIHRELGDFDDRSMEIAEYRKKIRRARMPREADKEARKQLKRLEQMYPDSAEATIVRTYLDWLTELPWKKATKDVIDIQAAKRILDTEHYGLKAVKDRVLEYLSVRKLNPKMKGPILCFVGPPGVGKTSLGQAIARSLNRKFVRVSLGGLRDEAEIRGHRRTYIGALPGRILQGLKQCGTNNPVFMMDEIDKLGADFRGDPASALLEALDPEQNFEFSDHYLNIPFNLSNVMFILTANMTDSIPPALLDRMEIIILSGYSEEEKRIIAYKHLIPRQLKETGLRPDAVHISPTALSLMIREYTAEAGLRNLEREIQTICRKVARRIAEGQAPPFRITKGSLVKFLGIPKFIPEMEDEPEQVGLATGLAWTQVGGEVMYVEATLIPGKGELILTGQLGEVMQESARAAVSYARKNLDAAGVDEGYLDNLDIHIHVPAGATPKDGPSAGIAMAAALISAIRKKPVDTTIAMTGEITLLGRVLPVGGLKEKALGALRTGIRTIVIPDKNQKELKEMPPSVKRRIRFVPVRHMDEVLSVAFGKTSPARSPKKP
ncbi:MAG: endopeptidase La [Deltaproteobacteria bacterium]|nr:endopeptidase La [Deltaproteobacteria bacterium]MBW2041678.1 endopeptidase La [Deltaproteobacteria bacterium]MBW2131740.1 endopeptidase La [Deltaproteobacteria bacterium]